MYKDLADVYDLMLSDFNYDRYFTQIVKSCHKHVITLNHVLEIGSGTGEMTRRLARLSSSVDAIEPSAEMYEKSVKKYAYSNVKYHNLRLEDFHPMDRQYDLIVAALDIFNYFYTEKALQSAFSKAYQMASNHSLFVFDMSSLYYIDKYLKQPVFFNKKSEVYFVWQNYRRPQKHMVDFQIDFFVPDRGKYIHLTERQTMKGYPVNVIRRALLKSGFKEIVTRRLEEEDQTRHPKRLVFLAKK